MSGAKGLAVVTGASSGIGAEIARLLAERGYDCVLTARRKPRLEELAAELRRRYSVEATVVQSDLSTTDGAAKLYDEVRALGQPVTFLVNNAGFGLHGHFVDMDPLRVLQMIQLNMTSLTTLTQLFARDMVGYGHGRVLQVASVGAFQPSPYYSVYSATKSYVRDFSQALGYELRGTGVTVTTICPGLTRTEFHEVAEHIKPSSLDMITMSARSVAEIAVRGAEQGRAHVTPGFANRLAGWLAKLMPRGLATALAGRSMRSESTERAPEVTTPKAAARAAP